MIPSNSEQINWNVLPPGSVIVSINMCLQRFDKLQEKHRLAKPLSDVKAAFLAKFEAAASDVQIQCFDDWIARCGRVPASVNNSDIAGAGPAKQIFELAGTQ